MVGELGCYLSFCYFLLVIVLLVILFVILCMGGVASRLTLMSSLLQGYT